MSTSLVATQVHIAALAELHEDLVGIKDALEIASCSTLSAREWFAGMAMQGLLACSRYGEWGPLVENAVKGADALRAELAKERDDG